jgi:hypothetical protein
VGPAKHLLYNFCFVLKTAFSFFFYFSISKRFFLGRFLISEKRIFVDEFCFKTLARVIPKGSFTLTTKTVRFHRKVGVYSGNYRKNAFLCFKFNDYFFLYLVQKCVGVGVSVVWVCVWVWVGVCFVSASAKIQI